MTPTRLLMDSMRFPMHRTHPLMRPTHPLSHTISIPMQNICVPTIDTRRLVC